MCNKIPHLLSALICILLFSPAHAADDIFVPEATVKKYERAITRVEDYLTRTQSIIADFTQVAPDGALATGKFYLQRPGKMRWQYNPPVPVLMVSNGSELVYFDYELEQVTHIPLAGSLISFLAKDQIKFGGDVGITFVQVDAKVIRIEVAQKANPSDGKLMLELSDVPLKLRNMVITDSTGQVTKVALANAQFNVDIDSGLFKFIDPRKRRR